MGELPGSLRDNGASSQSIGASVTVRSTRTSLFALVAALFVGLGLLLAPAAAAHDPVSYTHLTLPTILLV